MEETRGRHEIKNILLVASWKYVYYLKYVAHEFKLYKQMECHC